VVDVPSAAGGDAGLEGFSVATGEGRVGRVAALNRLAEGLVVVVDDGEAYRVVAAAGVARVELLPRRVRLSEEGARALATAPAVEARVVRVETPVLVRHVPAELTPLVVAGERGVASRRSRRPVIGGVLTFVGGVALFIGAPLTALGIGGSHAWLWTAVTAVPFVVGLVLLWGALESETGRRLTWREKAADAFTAVLGISPHTRRRG
jgi:hypothetical protein